MFIELGFLNSLSSVRSGMCVNLHGKYLLPNLHSNRIRG